MKLILLIALSGLSFAVLSQKSASTIPANFVANYYRAYSNVPKAERLIPFYHDSVVIDDPTYDWVGKTKADIFRNFDRNNLNNQYTWRIDQQIVRGDTLVTEGLLEAKYAGVPYSMRFVNIFHFRNGKIVKQYDYFDNREWYKVVDDHNRKQNLEKDETVLRKLKEQDWPAAYREQDTVLLDRILADEFQLISSDGTVSTKREEIEYIKTHKPSYLSFKFEIERLEIFENNTAVVAGTGTILGKDKKGEYTFTYKSTNILIKRKGEWKAISSHTSGDKSTRNRSRS
jgi:ketosteroid isomerase-like protein